MSVELEGIDFAHPLTTELFDRTPEQRQARGKIVAQLVLSGSREPETTIDANRRLFAEFGEQIDGVIAERVLLFVADAVSTREHPPVDLKTEYLRATTDVRREIQELHEALPFPGLDRITAQHESGQEV